MATTATKTDIWRQKRATFLFDGTAIPAPDKIVYGNGGHVTNLVKTGNVTSGSATITNMNSTEDLRAFQSITGNGIPANTHIVTVLSDSSIEISQNATATSISENLTFNGLRPENSSRSTLVSQIYSKTISSKVQEDTFSTTLIGILDETELNGSTISEIGVIDTEGQLIAFYNLGPNNKGPGEEYEARIKIME